MMIMATKIEPITPAQLATELGTDARTTRKFLRSITPRDAQPGKGSRWSIDGKARNIASLRKQFAEFTAAQEAAKKARDEAQNAPEAPETDDEALDASDSLDELEGPTDDEMLADDEN
jgi:hypothetical protein